MGDWMNLIPEDRIIIQMREDGYTANEIIEHLGWVGTYAKRKLSIRVKRLTEAGLIERKPSGAKKKVKVDPNSFEHVCAYPRCKLEGSESFALVPLCPGHAADIMDETIKYYKTGDQSHYIRRKHFLKIIHLIPWRYEKDGEHKDLAKRNTGVPGVTYHPPSGKYSATVYLGMRDGKSRVEYLGLFGSVEDAQKEIRKFEGDEEE